MTDWTDAGAFDDIPDGGCRGVEIDGEKLLLTRRGGEVSAMDGVCPHAGAPLSKGAAGGGEVVCPFHHAVFDLRSGARRAGPGVGDLRRRHAMTRDGRVFVGDWVGEPVEATLAPERAADEGEEPVFAVIGAGAAGLTCAIELRRLGAPGRVTLIDRHPAPLYERTLLSKQVLAGKMEPEDGERVDRATLERIGVETMFGREARALDPQARRIVFDDGDELTYDACFAAPGGRAGALPGAEDAPDGVLTLRSPEDALTLRERAREAGRLVVIGGGFIGMEAAAALAGDDMEIELLAREPALMDGAFGDDVSEMLAEAIRDAGATVRLGAQVAGFDARDGRLSAVRLADGERIETPLALVAVGMTPEATLLDGLPMEQAAATVDATLQAAPGLWIGGDAAAKPVRGGHARTEHWRAAEGDGRRAAAAMLGAPPPADGDPRFFWTAIGGPIHVVGEVTAESRDLGSVAERSFTRYFLRDGAVVGAIGAGKADETAALHLALRRAGRVSAEALAAARWSAAGLDAAR